jgi:hypothetical protein
MLRELLREGGRKLSREGCVEGGRVRLRELSREGRGMNT